MKKLALIASLNILIFSNLAAQSDPQMDRPIQQCILQNQDKVSLLKKEFSMGHWLGKLMNNCEKLQGSSGKGGGPHVVTLLEMEKELDELLALSENCKNLSEPKVKEALTEMKKVFQEKEKVESFQKGTTNNNNNNTLFDEDDEIITMSLTRGGAGKIKNLAEKIKKNLKK
jgi:hypothetical protein